METLIPWIFGAITMASVIFLLISIIFGDVLDFLGDFDLGFDMTVDAAESGNLGCMVISAFFAGFGSIGLFGTLAGWHLIFSITAGIAFGLIFGRTVAAVLKFVMQQEGTELLTSESLIGQYARITVNIPAGRTGEAIVEGESLIKYPVKAVSDEVELKKGDYVEVVDIQGGRLYVKKKNS